MGIQFAHNIKMRLAHFSFFLHPEFAPLNSLFFSMSFCGKQTWRPLDNAMPSNFPAPKSWVSDLFFEVSFVSVLAMVCSELWKKLEEIFFRNDVISKQFFKPFQYSERTIDPCKPPSVNILKGQLTPVNLPQFNYVTWHSWTRDDLQGSIASTETDDTSKGRSDTQLFGAGKFEGLAWSWGLHAHLLQKDIEKNINSMKQIQDAKIK